MSALRHFRAILMLPFMVTVVIPGMVLFFTGPDTFGLWQSFPATRVALPVLEAMAAWGIKHRRRLSSLPS